MRRNGGARRASFDRGGGAAPSRSGRGGDNGRRALILAGGELDPAGAQAHLLQGPWDEIVAADGGARHASALGLSPTVLLGDMDSIDPASQNALKDVPTLTFPAAKDKTDAQIAVEWALERGAKRIVVAGGLGGRRFDHALANTQLLAVIARAGAFGVVTDGRQAVHLLAGRRNGLRPDGAPARESTLVLEAPAGFLLSVVPLGECRGLRIGGARWELDGYDLAVGDTRTISNEFIGEAAVLSLEQGLALVVTGPKA